MTAWIERENPARPAELVGQVSATMPGVLSEMIGRAHGAWPAWTATPLKDRLGLLAAAVEAALSDAALDRLAPRLCAELGKPAPDARGELAFSRDYALDVVRRAPAVLAERVADDDTGRWVVTQEPFGVVAALAPWNAPIILAFLKVAPALATGNTVVVKPSPLAPLTITEVVETMAAALPDGVLAVANGGAEVGAALCRDPRVAKIAFTGGGATAVHIGHAAADHLVPTVMELGGNDAAIVLDDADLSDAAMDRLVLASHLTSGQVCMAAKRLLVPAATLDAFVDAYRAAADRVLRTGDPARDGVTIGPLVTRAAADRVDALVDEAVLAGATVHRLGQVDDDVATSGGYFVTPSLVVGLDDAAPLVADEQFGPTVPVLGYRDLDEAVTRANGTPFGLAASVWSADEERAELVARRLRAGTVFVNTHNRTGMSLAAPFGGFGASGYGREYGDEGIAAYVQPRAINAPAAFRPGAAPATGSAAAYPSGGTR